VFAIVSKRLGFPLLRRINSLIFNIIAHKMRENLVPKNLIHFRLLLNRCYRKSFRLEEVNPFLRLLIASLRFESPGIPIERLPRFGGKCKE
jgi:dolichol-phosphate mannosyltransferase